MVFYEHVSNVAHIVDLIGNECSDFIPIYINESR